MSAQDRLDALAVLAEEVRAGTIARNSKEWSKRREAARRLDPAYVEKRRAYMRAKYHAARGNESSLASYRSQMAARVAKRREDRAEKREQRKFQCVQKQPHMTAAQKRDREAVEAALHAIQAEAQCAAYVPDRGYRIRCMLQAGHDGRCAFRRTA